MNLQINKILKKYENFQKMHLYTPQLNQINNQPKIEQRDKALIIIIITMLIYYINLQKDYFYLLVNHYFMFKGQKQVAKKGVMLNLHIFKGKFSLIKYIKNK